MPIDFGYLEEKLIKKQYRYEDVKDKLVKVAWDIVQFKPSEEDIDGLWQIKQTPDGEVIVAMYSDDNVLTASRNSPWQIIRSASNDFNVFYKDAFITKIASSQIEIPLDEVDELLSSMKETLANDKSVVRKMTSGLSTQDKIELFSKYPELA